MKASMNVMLILLVVAAASGLPDGEHKRYEFEQARIIIEKRVLNASVEIVTTDTVYVDDWGQLEVRHSREVQTVKMLKNQTQESRRISIIDGAMLTSYDPLEKRGTRMKNPFSETLGKMSRQQQEKFAEGIASAFEAKTTDLGSKVIAGKSCTGTDTKTGLQGMETVTTTWIWKGFVLETSSKGMGSDISEKALSVDESIGVSTDLLVVPSDVTIQEMTK